MAGKHANAPESLQRPLVGVAAARSRRRGERTVGVLLVDGVVRQVRVHIVQVGGRWRRVGPSAEAAQPCVLGRG